MRCGVAGLILVVMSGCAKRPEPVRAVSDYVDPKLCAGCHAAIWKTYQTTGMGRSFFRAVAGSVPELESPAALQHEASGLIYQFDKKDTRYVLRRWETGFDGKLANAHEAEIHYVMGSGNHVRSYLSRTAQGRLAELPVAWYAERRSFAMSPGYDRADHQDFRRKISTDCMFCHNAYPAGADVQPASEPVFAEPLPLGIDCQRCHGPGRAHVEQRGRAGTIINPVKLGREKSLEVCMQCHLETTSFPLPNSLLRFGRGAFSYRPGEPLESFVLHFDHAKGSGREEKFEIVNSAYRLRQSKCFLKSDQLQCTTCHNPHQRGVKNGCQHCHPAVELAAKKHQQTGDCASCHMPKRRSEDVVHAVMTDHKIQRRAPTGALDPRKEIHEPAGGYRGEVSPYYPPLARPDTEVYVAIAQVIQRSNLKDGIPRLEALIQRQKPREPQPYFALAQALAVSGEREKAIANYRLALERNPQFVPALGNLGEVLHGVGRLQEAIEVLERARGFDPERASVLHTLGQAYRDAGRSAEARAALSKAIELDPDFAEAHNSLGGVLMDANEAAKAIGSFREAIRHQPSYSAARANLGNALMTANSFAEAEFHYRKAIALAPGSATAHYGYGVSLMIRERVDDAQREMETTLRLDPAKVEAMDALGRIYSVKANWAGAVAVYERALRAKPGFERAHLGLGTALAASGRMEAAKVHLNKAAASRDEGLRRDAAEVLKMIH